MNEIEERTDLFIDSLLGKLTIKQQRFVASVVLGENPIQVIKDLYNVGDDGTARIKQLTLMNIPEISKAISELQKGAALTTKAKINSMMPEALNVIHDTIKDTSEDNKFKRLVTSENIVKMGIDMHKEENRKNENTGLVVKIENVNISSHSKDISKIANSFIPKAVEEVEIVESVPKKENSKEEDPY